MDHVVDVFSGPGGLGTGFMLGGFHVAEAIDISPVACRTYQSNHSETKVVNNDIRNLSFVKGDYQGVVAGVVAGPPCQEFSIVNLRRDEDSRRSNLIYEFVRCVEEIKPLFAVLENVYSVPLALKVAIVKMLEGLQYKVVSRVIDCSKFGSVQTRRRWLTVATKTKHVFPTPSHEVRKAKEILAATARPEIVPRRGTLRKIQQLPVGRWAAIKGQTFKVYYVIDPEKPLPAVVNPCKLRYVRPDRSGYLSFPELFRAQGFPPDYKWCGTLSEKGQMLADSFPVEAATAFAKVLCDNLSSS